MSDRAARDGLLCEPVCLGLGDRLGRSTAQTVLHDVHRFVRREGDGRVAGQGDPLAQGELRAGVRELMRFARSACWRAER